MKRTLLLSVLMAISAVGLCTVSVSQTGTGTQSGTTATQPPATPLQPSSIVPDNPIILVPNSGAPVKPDVAHPKPAVKGNGLLPMTIPFRPWKGLITLVGLANGNNPATFIVSSGLNMSTVSPEDAIRLQLTTSQTKTHVAVLDASADAPTASILNLRLGAGMLHNINVAQVNLIGLLTRDSIPDAPTCWLGTSWLSGYQVTLDFETHTVTLDIKTAPFKKPTGIIVPFKLVNGRPVVKVTVAGGGSFDAVVDTGEIGTLIPGAVALKVKSKKLDKNTPKTGVDIGAGRMGRMVLPKISVGKAELKNLMVAYYGDAAPSAADKTMAIIGLDFLRRFRVTFSYAKSQMELLAPETVEAAPSAAPAPAAKKPGYGPGSSPFGTSPFGTSAGGTNQQGTGQSGTNPTGTIPH
jgi:hypothetical protein